MMANRATKHSVVARQKREARLPEHDWVIQYAAAVVIHTTAGVYWMPVFAGMTGE